MAEQTMAEQATKLTLSDIPERKVLEDGNQLLAEANAYLVLEKGVTERCGSLVNQHTIQLLRLPMSATPKTTTPTYKLVVLPREGESGFPHEAVLGRGVKITPALRSLRKRRAHFIKPDGEGLLKAIAKADGEEINLYQFEVRHKGDNPFLNSLGLGKKVLGLGFETLEEALGWYVYVATCCSIMTEEDPDFKKVIGHHHTSLAEHAAATHAVMLGMDDPPHAAAPAGATASYHQLTPAAAGPAAGQAISHADPKSAELAIATAEEAATETTVPY